MPSRETTWILPLVLVGLVAGTVFTMFSPVFGIPIIAAVIVVALIANLRGRTSDEGRARRHREQATEDVEFSKRDQETLV
jgi:uncharacterized oligopeptide transporter (OPT) family protein